MGIIKKLDYIAIKFYNWVIINLILVCAILSISIISIILGIKIISYKKLWSDIKTTLLKFIKDGDDI